MAGRDSGDVNITDQLDFHEVLGRGTVDDRHDGVRLGGPEADCEEIDVGVRSLGLAEREFDKSAQHSERVGDTVCLTDMTDTSQNSALLPQRVRARHASSTLANCTTRVHCMLIVHEQKEPPTSSSPSSKSTASTPVCVHRARTVAVMRRKAITHT